MFIAPEWNKVAKSALHRFVENILDYLLDSLTIEIIIGVKKAATECRTPAENTKFSSSHLWINRVTWPLQNSESRNFISRVI